MRHTWNIVEINGEQYYVDATNGDQPAFLEGGAVSLEEHKTTIYDYLCPFPQEYEQLYTASDEFPVPECTATDLNFYVLNQACFDTYDEQQIYDCCMRLENGAAVVRFKFTSQEAFDEACQQWIQEGYVQKVAEYYLKMYGLSTVEYHYGILDNLKTIYFMFFRIIFMNDILQQIMNMIENTRTVPSISSFSIDRFYSTADFWSDQLYSGISASAFLDDALVLSLELELDLVQRIPVV